MRYLLILSMMVISSGCGKIDLADSLVKVPILVKPYYNEFFEVVGKNREVAGEIVMGDLTAKERYGECVFAGFYYRITLDIQQWKKIDEGKKRAVIFHELTHCTFGSSKHSDDINSYMYKNVEVDPTKEELIKQTIEYTSHL